MSRTEHQRNLHNSIAGIQAILSNVSNNSTLSWDDRIRFLQEVYKVLPGMVRSLIYLKNTETW